MQELQMAVLLDRAGSPAELFSRVIDAIDHQQAIPALNGAIINGCPSSQWSFFSMRVGA